MHRKIWQATLVLSLLSVCSIARADVYVLGSSYSNDALPWSLADRPEWHVDCGRSLQYIYDNPQAPCELTSTIWTVALVNTRFAYISFQPVAGSGVTQQSDVTTISSWMNMQPGARGVIHATWPRPGQWEADFHDPNPDNSYTNYSQQYTPDLIAKLKAANPRRSFVSDRINEIFDSIYHDIQNDSSPLTSFDELFRDEAGHLSPWGQYIAHNALRQAFGQRTGIDNSTSPLPRRVKKYFDAKIRSIPRGN